MSEQIPTADRFWLLLDAACDGSLDEARVQELTSLLDSDQQLRKLFAHHVQLRTDIGFLCRAERARDLGIARIQAARQAVPPTAPPPVFGLLDNTIHGSAAFFSSGWPVAYLVATVICCVGLLIGSRIYVSGPEQIARQSDSLRSPLSPLPSIVGRITGMVDCQWESSIHPSSFILHPSSLVSLGDTFALASGLMEITYDTGAKVILQGPVTYEVESAVGGYLSVGKLTAKLEKKAENNEERRTKNEELSASRSSFLIPHSYFAVRTPTATVTDLGTEFGVEVSKEGNTTSHVFRGSVELRLAAVAGKTESAAQVLHENESARAERCEQGGGNRLVTVDASAKPAAFVRKLILATTRTFDLVDVVAGGDGFSGRRNRGIDPTNGQIADASLPPDDPAFVLAGDGKYHRTETVPFVDGVFIPNAKFGPVQIDSSGRTFDGFLDTEGTTSGYVWAGGSIPSSPVHRIPTTLDGIDYASSGHGLLFLHANKGMTFDLQGIRRANPDYRITRFRAIAGNVEVGSEAGLSVSADAWVLVDGQPRFRRREVNRSCGAMPASIPIGPNDRFLTLVATDGENGIAGDWILFGDPQLELTPIRTDSRTRNTEGH